MLALLLVAAALCPQGDLAQHHLVTGVRTRGDLRVVTAALVVDEGTAWDTAQAVQIERGGEVVVDLGEEWPLSALVLQADNDDEYAVDGSLDGKSWQPLWVAEADFEGPGLRTRHTALRQVRDERYLRVRPRGGDGNYSVARLRALCYVPAAWRNEWLRALSPIHWWRSFNNDSMIRFKGWVAFAGALLLALGAVLERLRRAQTLKRLRDGLLIALAIISFASWFNLFHYHFDGFVHDWEFFHYYLGAKYFPELGYTRLYECATAAELQVFGRAKLEGREIRNLLTNHLESAKPILDDPSICTSHFTDERWRAFVSDVMYFRGHYSTERWNDVIHDHGYNATPVWGIAGRALASGGPATYEQIHSLALLDPMLLIIMWCCCIWAFGWRATAVAMLWWGTNYPARWLWNGGAYLRMDWLALAVIGICLMRKARPGAAGFALTTSALLRIFPGFIVAAWLAKAVWEYARTRSITVETRRFVIGCAASLLILVPLSIAVCGVSSYPGFIANSKKHLATALTNNMGFKTVVGYQPSTRVTLTHDGKASDPFGVWKADRLRIFEQRRALFYLGVAAFLALIAWAGQRKPEWAVLALGVGFIPIASELTCYYYSIYLAMGFLWLRQRWLGVGLLLLSALTCAIAGWRPMEDEQFFWISIGVCLFAVLSCLAIARFDQGEEGERLALAGGAPPPAPESESRGQRKRRRGKK